VENATLRHSPRIEEAVHHEQAAAAQAGRGALMIMKKNKMTMTPPTPPTMSRHNLLPMSSAESCLIKSITNAANQDLL